jgi:hypothetical protein
MLKTIYPPFSNGQGRAEKIRPALFATMLESLAYQPRREKGLAFLSSAYPDEESAAIVSFLTPASFSARHMMVQSFSREKMTMSSSEAEKLKELIIEMSKTITSLTDDVYLKGLVNSVFDTHTVDATIEELRDYNEGYRPNWMRRFDDDFLN